MQFSAFNRITKHKYQSVTSSLNSDSISERIKSFHFHVDSLADNSIFYSSLEIYREDYI